MPWLSAARTHIGTVRRRNEDAVLERPDLGLWAVADGAGGHQRGDYASRRIVEALAEIDAGRAGLGLVEEVKACLAAVNRELRVKAAEIGPGALIGSTVVVLVIELMQSCCLWAGDSRFYRMRGGRLQQLSRDQSHVQNMVDRGEITREAAAHHPLSNILTNLVGGCDELSLEQRRDQLKAGDVLLLCSDGLSGAMDDAEIAAVLDAHPVTDAVDLLIDRALAHGARDNVSAVVTQWTE
jgi:serine/threonine protein phosphatase PrpC